MLPMRRGRPKHEVHLTVEETQQLEAIASSRSLPYGLVRRAQIILLSASGLTDTDIAAKVRLSSWMVGCWRKRYLENGIEGLYDEYRSGKPRTIDDEDVASLLRKTLAAQPPNGTHWTCRALADETGVSKSTVQRIWSAFGIQPHRQKHFQLSSDPFFVEKVRDIVGLYLNPPDNAMVLCVDEKSSIQALDRTQPILPMGLGYVEGVTHHYIRNGTTTLFAALDVATGTVIAQCKPRHRHQEFLQFLRHIEANVPDDLDIHLVVDNYATHKHKKIKLWLAQRPRFHVHYTPTYSSWLNQVERWFGIITQRAIRRGTFRSVKELIRKIETFVENYNQKSTPFVWTATADSILQKLGRLCQVISGTRH
jgi:putative transposase